MLEYIHSLKNNVSALADTLKCSEADINDRVRTLRENAKETERLLAAAQSKLANTTIEQLVKTNTEIAPGVRAVSAVLDVASSSELELYADRLKEKGIEVVVVGANIDAKAMLLAAVKPEVAKAHKNLSAGNIIKQLSEKVDGKGGGRPDFARGGGTSPGKLGEAFSGLPQMLQGLV